MNECPVCLGAGEHDFTAQDAPLARLARVFGADYVPIGIIPCDVCDGTGEVDDDTLRDHEAWAVARTDQFLAGVDSGEIKI